MSNFIACKKSKDHVEAYLFTGNNADVIKEVLDNSKVQYEFKDTKVKYDYKTVYSMPNFVITQDRNVYYLDKDMYLVKDVLNTISTYTEARYKRLFEQITNFGIF